MAPLWPGREWVERPERRSRSRIAGWVVPIATRGLALGIGEIVCVKGVKSRGNLWIGVRFVGVIWLRRRVLSCEVVRRVVGVGSNG